MTPNNQAIYDTNWQSWLDMKVHGPASRWLRCLIHSQIDGIPRPESIHSVLDVGCGEGTTTFSLAKWLPNAHIVGVDFSKTGIQLAQSRYQRSNLRFVHDDDLQHLNDRYDLVCAFEVLEHVEHWEALLERISCSAKRFICLSFPTGRKRAFETAIGHRRNFRSGEVERFLYDRSFTPRVVFYAGFPFFSPFYRDLCNLTHFISQSFTTGNYGKGKIFLSQILYLLFRFFSTRFRFGDQFCGLFSRRIQCQNVKPIFYT